LHVPDLRHRAGFAMVSSMGLIALAGILEKNGFTSRVIHLGVEKILNGKFSIANYISDKNIRAVGVSLHWHYQSDSSINVLRTIKVTHPEIKTILGGYTASFFADEIMKGHEDVDFIIKGDGEVPLLKLMVEISKDKPDYSAVPNLSWRREGAVIHNECRYVATEAEIDELDFSKFSLFENFPIYTKLPPSVPELTVSLLNDFRMFPLCVGRGCPVNCSFCGGGSLSQQILNQRDKVIFRSAEAVLKTIKDAEKEEIDCLYVSFDPFPQREYYPKLFRKIRESGVKISMVFECWSLPTIEFIKEFQSTFGKAEHPTIVLSPESGSERLRKQHKGYFYTNSHLLECLQLLKEHRIYVQVWFTYPLPFETNEDVSTTLDLMKIIRKRLGHLGQVLMMEFDLDPGSPMYLFPERFGIIKKAKTFSDYCDPRMKIKFDVLGSDRGELEKAYAPYLDSPAFMNPHSEEKISPFEVKKAIEKIRS